jgi:hypothetical protein
MPRRPHYETEAPAGYRDGQFQPAVLTPYGKRVHDFFEKTSKHDLFVVAEQLAARVAGDGSFMGAIRILEEEKATCKANGLLK